MAAVGMGLPAETFSDAGKYGLVGIHPVEAKKDIYLGLGDRETLPC